jgi:hypothetical protein
MESKKKAKNKNEKLNKGGETAMENRVKSDKITKSGFKVILFLLVFYFLSSTNIAFAISGGIGYFSFGLGYGTNFSDMNKILKNETFPTISPGGIQLGGGGFGIIKNITVGGEGYGFFVLSQPEAKNLKISFGGGFGTFNFGYVVYNTKSFILSPFIGVGWGSNSITVQERTGETIQFDSGLLQGKNLKESIVSRGVFVLSAGVAGNFLTFGKETAKSFAGLILGFRLGYIFEPFGSKWKIGDSEVKGIPSSFSLSRIFLNITIGGGGVAW